MCYAHGSAVPKLAMIKPAGQEPRRESLPHHVHRLPIGKIGDEVPTKQAIGNGTSVG